MLTAVIRAQWRFHWGSPQGLETATYTRLHHVINTLLSSLCRLHTLFHLMKTLKNAMVTIKYGSVILKERKMIELAL